MDSQEQSTANFQKTLEEIVDKSEAQFTDALKRISKHYINDYTFNLNREVDRIAARVRSENLKHLKRDLFEVLAAESSDSNMLTMSQIVTDLIGDIISSQWKL